MLVGQLEFAEGEQEDLDPDIMSPFYPGSFTVRGRRQVVSPQYRREERQPSCTGGAPARVSVALRQSFVSEVKSPPVHTFWSNSRLIEVPTRLVSLRSAKQHTIKGTRCRIRKGTLAFMIHQGSGDH